GIGSSFDYRLRDLPRVHDRIASAGLGGPMFEVSARDGGFLRFSLSVQYAFAMLRSLAYRANPDSLIADVIKTELRGNGYYYGQGVMYASTLMVDLGPVGLSADGRGGWYWSIDSGDVAQSTIQRDVLLRDRRLYLTTAMWTRPLVGAIRFGLEYQHVWRTS